MRAFLSIAAALAVSLTALTAPLDAHAWIADGRLTVSAEDVLHGLAEVRE